MKVFLAGTYSRERLFRDELPKPKYILESFYYVKPWQIKRMAEWEMFLLDSGAFTFMSGTSGAIDWKSYIDRYCDFITQNNIKYFFELDIDSIVGYEKVKQIRSYIEDRTGRPCIPVWHKSRGIDDFVKTAECYDYMAVGGIVTKEIKRVEWPYFSSLINIAHKNKCKIHGLGFTATKELHKYHFDSVDSTKWLSASRFGQIQIFKDGCIQQVKTPDGKKTVHYHKTDDFIFGEWIKFQRYAETNL